MNIRIVPAVSSLVLAAALALLPAPASAADATGTTRVTVAYRATPFKDALKEFEARSGLRLAYDEALVADAAPVTLKRENAPAEKVLLEILRPQGLEAVLTDQNLAAVVPAWSDQGMAKAFGRALAIGIALGNKLDGAKVVGDEVRVPGWTDEDDADLALGITDLIVSIAYASGRSWTGGQFVQEERVEAIRALLHSADPMVRAGALTLLANYGLMNSGIREFGREIEQGFSDPHSVVRTASAFQFAVAAGIKSGQWQGQTAAAAVLRKLAADPEAGVRMAAAFALLISSHHVLNPAMDPDGALLDQLLADRSAFVRQTLRLGALALNDPRAGTPDGPAKAKWLALNADDGLKATLRDPNPIARAVSFAFARIMQSERQHRDKAAPRDRVAEVWTAAELAKDPWMKTVHGLIAPALAGDYQVALEKTVAAAGSDKPSHLAAAGLTVGVSGLVSLKGMTEAAARGVVEKPAPPKIPDLAPLVARLASSKWLWARLPSIALDAALPFVGPLSATPLPPEALKAAADRQQAALRDPSEPVRLVALIALGGKAKAGVPCPPEPILAALRSRTPAEAQLGAIFAGESLSADALLAEIETLLADATRRGTAKMLLRNVWMNAALRKQTPDARLTFVTKLVERVVATQDPELAVALYEWIGFWANREQQKAFTNLVLTKGSLAALAATSSHVLNIQEAEARILLDRLKAAAADPAQRTAVLEAWGAHADRLQMFLGREALGVVLALLDQAMAGEPADARAAAARLRALPTLFSGLERLNQEKWGEAIKRLPANLAKALERALASAGDPAPSAQAVSLLVQTVAQVNRAGGVKRGWLREAWTANHPTLIQALDGAVRKVLAGTREEDKIDVWSALARAGDKPAIEALAERILDGRVPDQKLRQVMDAAAANPDLVPPAFGPALLKLVRDPAQSLDRRLGLLGNLNTGFRRFAGEIEALAWDEKFEPKLRSVAMSFLVSNTAKEAVPALIQKVLKAYDALPVEMIENNLPSLAYNHLATPGVEDLLVRMIEDKRLRGGLRWMNLRSLLFHLTQAQGLDQLKAPDRLLRALDKLEKEWPAERRNEFEAHIKPRLQELRQKLDQLKPARQAVEEF